MGASSRSISRCMIRVRPDVSLPRELVARPENSLWIRRQLQHFSAIANAAKEQPRENREPAADRALGEPQRGKERGADRENPRALIAPSAELRNRRDSAADCKKRQPVTAQREDDRQRQSRKLDEQSPWPSHLVVCLANSLRPEMPDCGWSPENINAEERRGLSSRGNHRSNELEVLEHCVPIVPASRAQYGAPHRKRPGPIAARHSVEEHSASVPPRVPGKGIEIVLRTSDIDLLERRCQTRESVAVVADIVVGDNHSLK